MKISNLRIRLCDKHSEKFTLVVEGSPGSAPETKLFTGDTAKEDMIKFIIDTITIHDDFQKPSLVAGFEKKTGTQVDTQNRKVKLKPKAVLGVKP